MCVRVCVCVSCCVSKKWKTKVSKTAPATSTPYKTRQKINLLLILFRLFRRLPNVQELMNWIESQTIRREKEDDDKSFGRIKRAKRATSICQNQLKFNFLSHFFSLLFTECVCAMCACVGRNKTSCPNENKTKITYIWTNTHAQHTCYFFFGNWFCCLPFFGIHSFLQWHQRDQRKLNQTNCFWLKRSKERSHLPGWVPMETILTVRLSDRWETHGCACVCFFSHFHRLLLRLFVWPLSKKFQFANLIWSKNWRRHGTFKCVRAHVSSFHDFLLLTFDFSVSCRMQRINSQNDIQRRLQYEVNVSINGQCDTVFITSRYFNVGERKSEKEKNEW